MRKASGLCVAAVQTAAHTTSMQFCAWTFALPRYCKMGICSSGRPARIERPALPLMPCLRPSLALAAHLLQAEQAQVTWLEGQLQEVHQLAAPVVAREIQATEAAQVRRKVGCLAAGSVGAVFCQVVERGGEAKSLHMRHAWHS